jgi:hypothetical protein
MRRLARQRVGPHVAAVGGIHRRAVGLRIRRCTVGDPVEQHLTITVVHRSDRRHREVLVDDTLCHELDDCTLGVRHRRHLEPTP